MTLIADFLAGSIMTLVLPVALLIALVWWYLAFLRRVPEPTAEDGVGAAGPGAAPTSAAELGGVAPAAASGPGSSAPASAPDPRPGAPGGGGQPGAGGGGQPGAGPTSGEI